MQDTSGWHWGLIVRSLEHRNVDAIGSNGGAPQRAPLCYGGEQNPREVDLGRRNRLHCAAGKTFPSRRAPVEDPLRPG